MRPEALQSPKIRRGVCTCKHESRWREIFRRRVPPVLGAGLLWNGFEDGVSPRVRP